MRKIHLRFVVCLICIVAVILTASSTKASSLGPYAVFLPMLEKNELPPPEPTTPVPPSPEPTTPAPTTPAPANVQIITISYEGFEPIYEGDEYAEIKNLGETVNLQGWRLNAGDPGQDFYFPDFSMAPGQVCRVYTDEVHPEYCGFSFESETELWKNTGDCGYLYDPQDELVDVKCYLNKSGG
jgi:hypothetical protein